MSGPQPTSANGVFNHQALFQMLQDVPAFQRMHDLRQVPCAADVERCQAAARHEKRVLWGFEPRDTEEATARRRLPLMEKSKTLVTFSPSGTAVVDVYADGTQARSVNVAASDPRLSAAREIVILGWQSLSNTGRLFKDKRVEEHVDLDGGEGLDTGLLRGASDMIACSVDTNEDGQHDLVTVSVKIGSEAFTVDYTTIVEPAVVTY